MSVEVNFSFQKEWNIVIKISDFTLFRVVFHSNTCCPLFNSLNEWKFTRLHLERWYVGRARAEGAHGDLDGGQRSSEVNWGKLCAMATIFGQKKP